MEILRVECDLVKITHRIIVEQKPISMTISAIDLNSQFGGTHAILYFTKGSSVRQQAAAQFYSHSHADNATVIKFIDYLKDNRDQVARELGIPAVILMMELDTILDKLHRS